MSFRKLIAATALSAALLLPAAAYAQGAPTVGAAVTDAQGGAVGTITAVNGDTVTLRTDRHEVALPVTSFTVTEDAVLVGVTQQQLNAQVDAMLAQAQQQFVVGAVVHDRDGAVVGPIQELDAETVTVQLGEQQVRLPRASVAARQSGLVIGASLAELQAQLAGATTPAPTADGTN